jgi:hypothetical protein
MQSTKRRDTRTGKLRLSLSGAGHLVRSRRNLGGSLAPPNIDIEAMPTETTSRWFYRCNGCLSVVASEELLHAPTCSACGKTFVGIGKVIGNRLGSEYQESVCDDRCTYARGPNCGCVCGGKNHGSHMTVTVRKDLGAIPQLVVVEQGKALARVAELDALWARYRALDALRYGYIPEDGRWLPRDEFMSLVERRNLRREFNRCAGLKVHSARVRGMVAVLARLGDKPAPVVGQSALFA